MPPSAGLLALAFPALELSPWAALLFAPALALGFAVRFLVEWTLALAAFWTTRVSALNQLSFVAMLFLFGQLAPLSLFPEAIRLLAAALPFRWTVAFPVELLIGRPRPGAAGSVALVLALWGAALLGGVGLSAGRGAGTWYYARRVFWH
jgi:ABC-2 type transport system permease protein